MSNNILNYQEFVSVMNANNVNQYGFSTFKSKWNNQQGKKQVPEKPSSHYEEWVSWHVVVSCGYGANKMSYGDFCKLMLDNNITINTYAKFRNSSPEKELLPRSPSSAYAEWNSWDNLDPDSDYKMKLDFIGFCQLIYKKCSTRSKYKNFRQAYDGIYFLPGKPENYYKEWCGWENIREDMTRRFATFDEFKSVVIRNLVPKHLWGEMYKSFDNEKYYLHSKPWEFYEEYSKWPISSTRRRLSYKTVVFLMYETGLSWEALYKSKNFDMTKEAPPYYGDIWEGHECIKHGNSILLCLGYEAFCKVIQENKVKEENYREFTFQYNLNTEAGNLLPLDPKKCYGKLWLDWDEVLGNKKKRAYPPFTQFLKIANKNEFLRVNYITKAKRIKTKYLLPDNPLEIYDECSNWFDITGVPEVVEYEEFTKFVLENEITLKQWLTGAKLRQEYAEQNPGKILPGDPQEFYAEYTSWKHIYNSGLSPQRAPDGREYMPFVKFEELIKESKIIASRGGEYTKLRKDKDSEYALPYDPYAHYGDQLKIWPYTNNGKSRIKGMQPISELKKLCRGINCTSVNQFDQYRAEHPELLLVHSDSWRKMDGFISTDDVLGKPYKYVSGVLDSLEKIIKFQSLDITISDVTEDLYKELTELDDALVPEPLDYYNLDEWDDLLTFKFYTLEDIKNFCKINSISTNTEYIKHMQKNPYMRPLDYYARQCFDYSKGILAEREYFKSSCDPNYEEWIIYATDWIKSQKSQASRRIIIKNYINGVLSKNKLETRPGVYFHVDSEHGTLQEIFGSVIDARKNIVVSTVNSYLDYCLENSCGDRDPETKELVILEGFKNPFSEMDDDNEISIAKKNETVKPILPYSDIVNAQNHLLQPEAESFSGLTNAQSIYSSDWYYVDKEDIDFNDPDCVWRASPAKFPKKPYQMWFPGSAVAMAALLYTPHRGRQIVFCDSGEADISKLVVNKESGLLIYEWQENNNALACAKYNGKKRTSQGMLLKLSDTLSLDEQIYKQKILWEKKYGSLESFLLDVDSLENNASSIGCYTTTNKTATLSKGGHSVPYIPEPLIKWLIKLRDWQSKYNPIEKLVSWKEVPNTGLTDKAVKQLDHQSFLFRNASGKNKFERCLPITTGKAFNALALLLSRIQAQEFPLSTRNPGSDVNTYNGWSSKYTPHCLRASLITAYILDGGIAPHIVQKMVGHHSIIMTLYYTKVGLGDVRQHFSEAEEKMLHKAPERIKKLIYENKIEELASEFTSLSDNTLNFLSNSYPVASYGFMDIGVCLQSCYGCHEGGIQDDNSQKNSIPVPKGYRAKNCPSCKYFLTGPAFIFGMQALQNEILIASEDAVEKMDEFLLRKQEVEGSIYEFRVAHPGQNTPTELTLLLNKHQMAYLLEAEKIDIYGSDITKLETLVRQSTAILNSENTQDGYQLIANDFKHIERSIEDCSNLRLYYEGLKNGIIYASIDASKAIDKSTDIISNIADNNGLTPKFYKLDKNQKLKSAKQFMDLLLVATDFSWERIENIVDGNLYLSDLNENEKVESIKLELQNSLDGKTSLLLNKTGKI